MQNGEGQRTRGGVEGGGAGETDSVRLGVRWFGYVGVREIGHRHQTCVPCLLFPFGKSMVLD